MFQEKTLSLTTPIVLGDINVTELNLKEPTAGNLKAVQHETGHSQNIKLISLMTKQPVQIIELLSMTDYQGCVDFLGDLFSDKE